LIHPSLDLCERVLGLFNLSPPLVDLFPQRVEAPELVVGGFDVCKRVTLLLLDLRELANQLLPEPASAIQIRLDRGNGLEALGYLL
jgi:hypothetical protein